MFGDMDQPAAVNARIGGNAPAPQGLDQPVIATAPLQRRGFEWGEFLFDTIQHFRAHASPVACQPLNIRLIASFSSCPWPNACAPGRWVTAVVSHLSPVPSMAQWSRRPGGPR